MPSLRALLVSGGISTVASMRRDCNAASRSEIPPARMMVTLFSSIPQWREAVTTAIWFDAPRERTPIFPHQLLRRFDLGSYGKAPWMLIVVRRHDNEIDSGSGGSEGGNRGIHAKLDLSGRNSCGPRRSSPCLLYTS